MIKKNYHKNLLNKKKIQVRSFRTKHFVKKKKKKRKVHFVILSNSKYWLNNLTIIFMSNQRCHLP